MSEAARQDDPIAHTSALEGLVGGLLAGVVVGAGIALVGAAVVGTGGLAAVAIVGGAASLGAEIGQVVGGLSKFTSNTGRIIIGSPDVFINGHPAARASLSEVMCDKHGPHLVAEGSESVYINGMPASRVGDHSTCGGKISAGSANVWIGGESEKTEEIASEVPTWLRVAVIAIGLGSAVGLVRRGVISLGQLGKGVAGGVGGEFGGHLAGGARFGEDSDGQKLTALGGALLGGVITGGGWKWFNSRYQIKMEGLGSNLGNVKVVRKVNGRAPINSEYSGNIYPNSKLPANIRTRYPDGVSFNRDGFPVFPSKVDVKLPLGQQIGTRSEHFKLANLSLRIQEQHNPGYLSHQGLNQRQIDHIMKNPPSSKSPPGLTWHHNEKPGVMQLVPRDIHDAVRHTGGHSIWGKGE